MWWIAALRAAQKNKREFAAYFERGRQAAFHI